MAAASTVLFKDIVVTEADKLSNLKSMGNGRYGMVYLATHSEYGLVAYKKLFVPFIAESEGIKLKKEATTQSRLNHPNIVRLMAMVYEPGHCGLILEFMDQGNMANYLDANVLGWKEKLDLIHQVALGMCYLHSQQPPIIHGDLEINNVLIKEGRIAKVYGFGLSHWKEFSQSRSKEKIQPRTVAHYPPEKFIIPNLRTTQQFDVYGFAIFVWQAATQMKPFARASEQAKLIETLVSKGERPDLTLLPNDVSRECVQVLKKCWSQDAKDRPSLIEVKKVIENDLKNFKTRKWNDYESRSIQSLGKIEIKNRIGVAGVARLEDKIFAIFFDSDRVVVFSDQPPFTQTDEIELKRLRDPLHIAACLITRSIFVTDWKDNRCIWKIQMPKKLISKFSVTPGEPCSMSTTSSDDLVVVVWSDPVDYMEIIKTSDLRPLKRIHFPEAFKRALFAVQTSQGNFVVLYGTGELVKGTKNIDSQWSMYMISEITSEGGVVRTFNPTRFESFELKCPDSICIDEDDNIIMTDSESNRVNLLNSSMTELQILANKEGQDVERPARLCYLREKQQLVVGQWGRWSSSGWLSVISVFTLSSITAKSINGVK